MKPLPRVDEVILSEEKRGGGTCDSPMRLVLKVHTKEGELLAERDSITEEANRFLTQTLHWCSVVEPDTTIAKIHKLANLAKQGVILANILRNIGVPNPNSSEMGDLVRLQDSLKYTPTK